MTRLSVRKNTAKPKPSKKEKFEINGSRSKYSKVVFTKSITAQKMKAARQAASAAFFPFGSASLKNMTTPPKETLTPQSADFLCTYCVLISFSVS
ncbi:hypothetical protein M769_0118430 [Bacillus haynesii]|nr:hypothetical protein M769_0118430 [Bacillus haynesii]